MKKGVPLYKSIVSKDTLIRAKKCLEEVKPTISSIYYYFDTKDMELFYGQMRLRIRVKKDKITLELKKKSEFGVTISEIKEEISIESLVSFFKGKTICLPHIFSKELPSTASLFFWETTHAFKNFYRFKDLLVVTETIIHSDGRVFHDIEIRGHNFQKQIINSLLKKLSVYQTKRISKIKRIYMKARR